MRVMGFDIVMGEKHWLEEVVSCGWLCAHLPWYLPIRVFGFDGQRDYEYSKSAYLCSNRTIDRSIIPFTLLSPDKTHSRPSLAPPIARQ